MLVFITSNAEKIAAARRSLSPLGIEFVDQDMDLQESQSDSVDSPDLSNFISLKT